MSDSNNQFIHISDVISRAQERATELSKLICIKDGYICFTEQPGYEIQLALLASEAEILRWSFHLARKHWMTLDLLSAFMAIAAGHNGIRLQPV